MTDQTAASSFWATAAALEEHSDTRTTVWFIEYPRSQVDAQWTGSSIYPSLRAAVEGVKDNLETYFAFDVFVHTGNGDHLLAQRDLASLLALLEPDE
ncbi:MAG: hypothetical protein LCH99_35970 [Proteobacteria bacterium]|nr:hypothetical protein [Pseudomonadota bacterium]